MKCWFLSRFNCFNFLIVSIHIIPISWCGFSLPVVYIFYFCFVFNEFAQYSERTVHNKWRYVLLYWTNFASFNRISNSFECNFLQLHLIFWSNTSFHIHFTITRIAIDAYRIFEQFLTKWSMIFVIARTPVSTNIPEIKKYARNANPNLLPIELLR